MSLKNWTVIEKVIHEFLLLALYAVILLCVSLFVAVKASVHAFMFDKSITQREKDLIKSLKVGTRLYSKNFHQ